MPPSVYFPSSSPEMLPTHYQFMCLIFWVSLGGGGSTSFGVLRAFDGELDAVGCFSFYFEFCAYARRKG